MFDENVKERFFDACKFSNHGNNKFILLLWKGVYPYKYMSDWEKQNSKKKTFYSHLNMGNITETNFPHAKRICKDFEIKNEGEYRDLYVQSHTLLLTDVFENFRNMFLEIYGLGSFKISFSFWISIASSFKKTKVKWDLLTDIDMLLVVEKVSDAWLKPYIDMSTDLRKKQKMILKKIF